MSKETYIEDHNVFMSLLGKCIVQWANIEEILFFMMRDILNVSDTQAAIIFYRTATLDMRRDLVSEIVYTAYPAPEKKDGGHKHDDLKVWDDLVAEIRDLLPLRNQMAHSPVDADIHGIVEEGGEIVEIGAIKFASKQAKAERARGKSEKKPLELGDLIKHNGAVFMLYVKLQAFRQIQLQARLSELRKPKA